MQVFVRASIAYMLGKVLERVKCTPLAPLAGQLSPAAIGVHLTRKKLSSRLIVACWLYSNHSSRLSIKVASANALLIGFRDNKQLSDRRTDYFGRIAIGMTHDGTGATVQLKIGNEVVPYAPISTAQELLFQLQKAMHEFGDKNYETAFMKLDSGYYATAEATIPLTLTDTTGLMHKHTDYSHPLLQYPLPGTHQRKRMAGTSVARTYIAGNVIPWQALFGTNRAFPNREPYFYSSCLVGFDLDAFEGVSQKIRSGRYLGNNSIFLEIKNAKFNAIDIPCNRNMRLRVTIVRQLYRYFFGSLLLSTKPLRISG
jgi:hypothetical protein